MAELARRDGPQSSEGDVGHGTSESLLKVSGIAPAAVTRVLLIEDNPTDAGLFERLLAEAYPKMFHVALEPSLQGALARVKDGAFDCVCVDLRIPDAMGAECVRELLCAAPGLPVVVLTGSDNEELALASVRAGAEDYLVKGNVSGSQIGHSLRYACERKRKQLELTSAAHRDPLTGLSNRRHFEERLARTLAHPSAHGLVTVILVDLDNFKPVNDTYGHAAGDALLVDLARRLTATVRDTDVCARLGGDEFAILLTQVHSLEEADEVAERVRRSLSAKFRWGNAELCALASIGVATCGGGQRCSVHALIDSADSAMYTAKRSGGNQVRFAVPHGSSSFPSVEPADDACLVYQSILTRTGQLVAQEALIQSVPSEETTRPSMRALAQEPRLGPAEQVIEAVVRDIVGLRRLGKDPSTFSVNIASSHLATARFTQILSHFIGRYELRPKDLELEVHLGHRDKNNFVCIEQLNKLAHAGFAVVLDDFCEDHVSLLRVLPIAGVKLAEPLQNACLASLRARRYLAGLVSLCHALDVWVGATHIETAAQLKGLLDVGCDRVQGNYLGPPNFFPAPGNSPLSRAMRTL
jgi:diguanylate cyclase (GGDEF)-like protein